MAVLSDLDQVHLVIDTVDHLPHAGDKRIYLKQQLQHQTSRTRQYIDKHGEDLPENTPLELEDDLRRTTEVTWSAVAPYMKDLTEDSRDRAAETQGAPGS
jgi:hypothetical protein